MMGDAGGDEARGGVMERLATRPETKPSMVGALAVPPLDAHPRDGAAAAETCVVTSPGGAGRWPQRAPGVEAEPPEPQEPGARHRRVRLWGRASRAGSCGVCRRQGADERAEARGEVDHRAAGEVEHAEAVEPALGPRPVGDGS